MRIAIKMERLITLIGYDLFKNLDWKHLTVRTFKINDDKRP
jgi:hypothetical protein